MALQVKSKDLILKWELTNMGKKIVIIGGGVVGMSTAFHLANNGIKDITIIEKDSIGSGSSSQAAGIVTCLQWNATSVVARMKTLDLFENFS